MAEVITVSALNRYVKSLFDANDRLFDLALRGEVANFVQNARSGHCYFTLRDEQASVKAVMFRSDARRLAFRPEEGMRVVVRCRATLYERDGAFQLYVNEMFPDGIGAAQLALEQLKARLEQEGLFDAAHKKPLPQYPRCIGLVTSKTGAALQDIRNVIGRRWPGIRLLLCPVMVQGFEAAPQIAAAIRTLDRHGLPVAQQALALELLEEGERPEGGLGNTPIGHQAKAAVEGGEGHALLLEHVAEGPVGVGLVHLPQAGQQPGNVGGVAGGVVDRAVRRVRGVKLCDVHGQALVLRVAVLL